ncbi:MAG: transposase [Oscillospiraceae bacterium]|nr:transposase [Oscillospiraceae bacterium]
MEGHMMPDHVHLRLSIPPKYSASSVMRHIKGNRYWGLKNKKRKASTLRCWPVT